MEDFSRNIAEPLDDRPALAVSACLLGTPCRFDGCSRPCEALRALESHFRFVPVCPETSGGLAIPRTPSEIVKDPDGTVHVVSSDGVDRTEAFDRGARVALDRAIAGHARVAILKAKSPSCGSGLIYDGLFSGRLVEGYGIAADLFVKRGIPVIDERAVLDSEDPVAFLHSLFA